MSGLPLVLSREELVVGLQQGAPTTQAVGVSGAGCSWSGLMVANLAATVSQAP